MAHTGEKKRATLADVARETGYSLTAVSRALRGKSDIGPEATAKIRDAARSMGYVVNQTAVALRYGRTRILTLIVLDLTNPFFSAMSTLIQQAAQKMGYTLMIVCNRGEAELEYTLVRQAIARGSDGILLFPTTHSAHSIELLRAAGTPFVLLSVSVPGYETDNVIIDDIHGAYLATRHLVEAGRKKLAFVSSYTVSPSYLLRKEGFLRACRELGIPEENRKLVVISPLGIDTRWAPDTGTEVERALAELRDGGFDGLFIFCDVEAWRAIGALEQSGIVSKEDFGIVSFDNIDGVLVYPIPLCSVDCGLDTMAEESISLLCARIDGETTPARTVVCPVKLVCRGTCGAGPDGSDNP